MGNESSKATCNDGMYGDPHCKNCATDRNHIRFVLIGRTGSGQSSTGNSLLGKQAFESSSETKSKTKKVKAAWAKHGCYDIKIVDSPGLNDTDLSKADDVEKAIKKMTKALLLCNGCVHVFLLVLKLGDKFTPEMKETVSDFKEIYGEDYLKERGIIVVTGGDNFAATMKNDGTPGRTFEEWVSSREQSEEFKRLVRECGARIVLFNNFAEKEEEREAQRNKLFKYAKVLRQKGCYTSEHFAMYREIKKKLTKERNFSLLKEKFQRKINLLTEELQRFPPSPTLENVDFVEAGIVDLLSDITNSENNEQLKPLGDTLLEILETAAKLKSAIEENDTGNKRWHAKVLQSMAKNLQGAGKIPWKQILKYILAAIAIGAVTVGVIVLIITSKGAILPQLAKAVPHVAPVLFAIGSSFLQN